MLQVGGGNNSTFTVRITSSTGTDTYSSITAAIVSLKGPLHGGVNIQVVDRLFHHLQKNIKDRTSVKEMDGEIYALLLAMARVVGCCTHRNEELNFEGKRIIRKAYKNLLEAVEYVPLKKH